MGPIVGADAASFRLLKDGHAADATQAYFWGAPFAVRDVASFAALDTDYAKDAIHAWYSYLDYDPNTGHIRNAVIDIKGVDAASFASKTNGYAVGARRTYYKGHPISELPGGAGYLSLGYAKSTSGVFYDGKKIRGANAATFTMMQSATDEVDATDRQGKYLNGKRV